MTRDNNLSKGFALEESLRAYFIRSGYFVARGLPYRYKGIDITDIDLWLYNRTPVSRTITIVDIKNKSRPQAVERIYWTLGLKVALSANEAIVATTDKRREIIQLGERSGVRILDGNFLARLNKAKSLDADRLSEEDLIDLVKNYELQKLDGGWLDKLSQAKQTLVGSLNFSGVQSLLYYSRFFVSQAIEGDIHRTTAIRLAFRTIAYLCICLDASLSSITFLEDSERKEAIRSGLQYGAAGPQGVEDFLDTVKPLLTNFVENGGAAFQQLKRNFYTALSSSRNEILVEYFSRAPNVASLFVLGRYFDEMSTSTSLTGALNRSDARSLIYVLLDFWEIERRAIDFIIDNTKSP